MEETNFAGYEDNKVSIELEVEQLKMHGILRGLAAKYFEGTPQTVDPEVPVDLEIPPDHEEMYTDLYASAISHHPSLPQNYDYPATLEMVAHQFGLDAAYSFSYFYNIEKAQTGNAEEAVLHSFASIVLGEFLKEIATEILEDFDPDLPEPTSTPRYKD